MIKADLNTKKFLADLARIHGGLHQATSRTVNNMASITKDRYNKLIQSDFTIRTQYTLRALKVYPSTYERKSNPGELRPLSDIRALMVIKNIKGKTHYLVIQEEGLDKKPQKSALGTASVPIAKTARAGGASRGRVSHKFNLRRASPSFLKMSGADFGRAGDGFSQRQRWAILNKYARGLRYGWDARIPFAFTWDQNVDEYAMKGKKIVTIRQMRDKKRRVRKRPNFEKAFNELKESHAQMIFNTVAGRILR